MGQFVAENPGSTELVWGKTFQQSNSQYRAPTLVLYDRQVRWPAAWANRAWGHRAIQLPRRRKALHRPFVLPTLDRDELVTEETRNVARAVAKAVVEWRAGRLRAVQPILARPRPQ